MDISPDCKKTIFTKKLVSYLKNYLRTTYKIKTVLSSKIPKKHCSHLLNCFDTL